jgi:hypothetical protein
LKKKTRKCSKLAVIPKLNWKTKRILNRLNRWISYMKEKLSLVKKPTLLIDL